MYKEFLYLMIGLHIFSILICMILFYANFFQNPEKTKRNNIYSLMVLTNIIASIFDSISYINDGKPDKYALLMLSNTMAIVFALVLILEFIIYICAYISEKKEISKKLYYSGIIYGGFSILVSLFTCFAGYMFTIENGVFVFGKFYPVYVGFNVYGLLVSIFVVASYHKTLGLHDTIAACLYISFPLISALISFINNNLGLAYQAVTAALVILYAMIQTDRANQLENEKRISLYYASHDELTGLKSRRSYSERIETLVNAQGNVGIVFFDINGLKYTNDHYGHRAGDELLKTFAKTLSSLFDKEDIYRISGDEFIVLMQTDEAEFKKAVFELKNKISDKDKTLACFGSQYGACIKINELISMSETIMYNAKDEYHMQHPEFRH